jgi:hypothetical protein
MKRIKITEKGWENYTGLFGMASFENGVSVDPLPESMADRISANVSTVEIDDDGAEELQAGAAARLVGGATLAAPVVPALPNPTTEEVALEQKQIAEEAGRAPAKFYDVEELQQIADEKGIKGLRLVAEPWGVRDRSIPALIKEILKAQAESQKKLAEIAAQREIEARKAAEVARAAEAFEVPTEERLVKAVAVEAAPKTEEQIEMDLEALAAAAEPVDAAKDDDVGFVGSDDEVPATDADLTKLDTVEMMKAVVEAGVADAQTDGEDA